MSNPFNTGGNIMSLFSDGPDYKVETLVKNPALQARLNNLTTDYDTTRKASSQALDAYISEFLGGNPQAKQRSEQEQNLINQFYDGTVQSELSALRRNKALASRAAVDRALGYARANQNLSRLGADGGGSSYDTRLGMKTAADIENANALDQTAQERADWDYLMRNRLGMIGQRTALADALAGRQLVPGTLRKNELGWNAGALGDMLKLDAANHFYGVGEDKDFLDKLTDFSYNEGTNLNQGMAMITNMISAIRGGSPSASAPPSMANANTGPVYPGAGGASYNWGVDNNPQVMNDLYGAYA